MTVPKDAVRNSDKVFYRTVRIYDKVVDADARKVLNSHPFALNDDSYDKKIITYVNEGMIRKSYKKPTSGSGTIELTNCAGYSGSTRTLCLASKASSKEARTHTVDEMDKAYPWTLGTSEIKFYAIKITGYASKGEIGKNKNGCVLFETKQKTGAPKKTGYIPSGWVVPEGDYTKLKAKFSNTCDCTVIPDVKAVIDEDDTKTKTCTSAKQQIVKDYDTVTIQNTKISNEKLFTWLINGTNPVSNVNITNTSTVKTKFNASASTSSCPIYCLDKETHEFMGSSDISYKYENRKLIFKFKNPYSGTITKTCATKNTTTCLNTMNTYLNGLKLFNIEYTNGVSTKKTVNIAGTKTLGSNNMTASNTIVYKTATYKTSQALQDETFTKKPEKDYKVSITVNGNKFTCPYEFDFPDEIKPNDLYYRMIDLKNVFPAHRNNNYGLNWRTTVAKELIKQIENKGEKVYNETPELTVTLNSKTIKEIKEYNKQKEKNGKGYYDNSVTCGSNGNESCFINDLVTKKVAVRGNN